MARAIPRRAAAGAALALGLLGCSQDFTPPSVVVDHRVLAMVAEPPELDGTVPGAATVVRAVEAEPVGGAPLPSGATLERRWTFCPFSLGASTGYACAAPQCELPLTPDPAGAVTVAPVALALACLQDPGVVLPPDLAGGTLPARVEVLVRYRLVEVLAGTPGREILLREAVQRVPVWTVPPTQELNRNPAFAAVAPVTVDGVAAVPCDPSDLAACTPAGTLSPAGPLVVAATVDTRTIQDYPAGDRTATEAFALSFFTTAGRFDFETGSASRTAPSASVKLKDEEVPAGTSRALLWVVLRDLRGGEAVAGPFRLDVAP